jgi:hypothetical protein
MKAIGPPRQQADARHRRRWPPDRQQCAFAAPPIAAARH